ncbi:hypothetical protein [Petroclostridium sp. X23]|uniref:hypothetical protein n=1 Tax=Petroclostridium sp. X23 TaxID=3045146 RepID=UPI0024AE2A01|nr:hypothetical protein [Petroclostridium sp. X23]WHH58306.1 hypothetical protein QKW49_21280 [Petroclostridium sp. X23]
MSKIYKTFEVQENETSVDLRGRYSKHEATSETVTIRGIIADSTPQEMERWNQIQHPVTHTIAQKGKPVGKEGDYLIMPTEKRKFKIQKVNNPGALDLWTLYYVEERRDV